MLFYKSSQKLLDHQGLGQVTHWSGLIHLQADSVVFPLRQRLGIHLTPMSPGEFTMEDVDFIGFWIGLRGKKTVKRHIS